MGIDDVQTLAGPSPIMAASEERSATTEVSSSLRLDQTDTDGFHHKQPPTTGRSLSKALEEASSIPIDGTGLCSTRQIAESDITANQAGVTPYDGVHLAQLLKDAAEARAEASRDCPTVLGVDDDDQDTEGHHTCAREEIPERHANPLENDANSGHWNLPSVEDVERDVHSLCEKELRVLFQVSPTRNITAKKLAAMLKEAPAMMKRNQQISSQALAAPHPSNEPPSLEAPPPPKTTPTIVSPAVTRSKSDSSSPMQANQSLPPCTNTKKSNN